MSPMGVGVNTVPSSLPRTRGDEPALGYSIVRRFKSAPHPRG